MQTGFALSVLSGVSCQGVLSVTIWCLKRCSIYITVYISDLQDQEHWENGAYLRYQSLLCFLVMVVVCVKGIEKEVLKKSVASVG